MEFNTIQDCYNKTNVGNTYDSVQINENKLNINIIVDHSHETNTINLQTNFMETKVLNVFGAKRRESILNRNKKANINSKIAC